MQCPQCRAENREGRSFCAKCGAPLAVTCPECGFANEPDVDFCGGCGRALSATAVSSADSALEREAPEAERRQLTVMFCDLVGSSALAERLDPEELHALLAQYQDTCADVIQRFDGHIARYVGDGLLVYFGYPRAHEDDPQRAVRTGLGIVEAIQGLDTKFPNPDVNLAVRIGIASGLVVAGDIGSGERREEKAVVGETPNLAARLQALADPNAVVIGESTQRLVDGLFDCDDLGPLRLKGISQPTTAYRVRQESRSPERARTPFVGRRAELRQFAGVIETCRDTGNGQAVYVRGEAGIGKTRLIEECVALAEKQGFASHQGLVLDFGVGKGQDAIRTLVRSLLDLAPSSDKPMRQAVADKVFADSLLKSDQRVFLNDLLDLPQSTAMRSMYDAMDNATRNRGKREVVTGLIKAVSTRQPILAIVEDVHWADSLTLAHLAVITAVVNDCRAVLLMTARIEGDPLDQAWRSSIHGSPLMTIDLAPLRQAEAITLTSAFIDATNRVATECIKRAAGNPLFLEQLLRNAEESEEQTVPASIQSLVLARMDRLMPVDKQAVQAASVIGQRFSRDTLQYLLDDASYECAPLIAHHLIRPIDGEYLFAHALIQEGVYSSLLKSRRRELHGHLGKWFSDRDPVLHAQHLDRAEDPAAPRAYLDAAKAQASDYRNERALQLAERGLALAKDKGDRFALTCLLGELRHDFGSVSESISAYQNALDLADDDVKRCQAWIGLAAGMRIVDRYDEALKTLDLAQAAAGKHELTLQLARIHHLRGNLYFPLGNIDGCLQQHELALNCARRARSPESEARALGGLGDAEYARGRMISAHKHFRRCVELCRKHGFGRIEVANLCMVADTHSYLNEFDKALDVALASVEAASTVGHHRAQMIGQQVAGGMLFEMGELEKAKELFEQAQVLAHQLGAMRMESENLLGLANILRARGRRNEALELLDQALSISRETGVSFVGPWILGIIAATTEDPNVRQRVIDEGEQILRSGAVSHNHFWFYHYVMEASLNVGDWDSAKRYAAALKEFTSSEPLPFIDFLIARGRALADCGCGKRDDATIQKLQRLRDEAARMGLKTALPALEHALASAGKR